MRCVFTLESQCKGVGGCIWKNRIGHWEGGRYKHRFVRKIDPRVCMCVRVCVSTDSFEHHYRSINVLAAQCRI